MLRLAADHGLYCQNKQSRRPGEWMNVDHVFIQSDTYVDFPLVAIEHENRDLSGVSKAGIAPVGDTQGAFIEWAAWKALSMRARLHVTVAYPWRKDKASTLGVLTRMVEGHRRTFDALPNALFLLGWWDSSPLAAWSAEGLYQPYVPVRLDDGAVTLSPIIDPYA